MGSRLSCYKDHSVNGTSNIDHLLTDEWIVYPDFGNRLLREIKTLKDDIKVQSYFRYESAGRDTRLGLFCIYGYLLPRTKPYNSGAYKVRIILSPNFPTKAPVFELLTPIFHPAVSSDPSRPGFCNRGCCSFNRDGNPAIHLKDVIKHYVDIIDQPEYYYRICDFNGEARRLYFQDKALYNEIASQMITKYASSR